MIIDNNSFRFIGENEHTQYCAIIFTYTKHDAIFFKEALTVVLREIDLPKQIKTIYWGSDGASAFKSTYEIYLHCIIY